MVARGPSPARRPRSYRTRRPVPAVLLMLVLSAVAGLVWVRVLELDQTPGSCAAEAAAAAVAPGQRLPADGLDGVSPAPPQQVRVQVFNAGGTRGAAALAGGRLSELGFAPTGTPANDPLHPAFDLRCHGEIRFGVAGQAAARTLSLAVPCVELVHDGRPDSMVDLALGTEFTALRPNDAARAVLQGLAQLGQPAPVELSGGGQAAQSITPTIRQDLFRQARQVRC